jgi:RNA ligase (TIGR02306 family)
MSTHEALVVKIGEVLPHPDPETINLGIVKVWDYQVVVNKNQWKEGDLAVFCEPDTMVDGNREEFAFLNGARPPKKHRIKAKRLRGCWSEGLLTPAPEGFQEGQDAWEVLGLERYQPPMRGAGKNRPRGAESDYGTGGTFEAGPDCARLPFSKYDLENFKKWNSVFQDGEEILINEKIHGSSSMYFWHEAEGRMYCGSRSGWRNKGDNIWWQALVQTPFIEEFCANNPNVILFGEVFGAVQDLAYGASKNQIFFRAFDMFDINERKFVDADRFIEMIDEYGCIEYAPILYRGPYSKEVVLAHTDGQSLIPGANHIREGCVVKTIKETTDPKLGRKILKSVSNLYLERPS